jgi:[ribosomal protein S18]-alanine N-acetyltransferase
MTGTEPLVRLGKETDLLAVARIERESFSDPWSLPALLGELEPSYLHLPLVAELDGEIAGYLMAWRVHDELHILNLAVAIRLRRRGVADALMAAAMDDARRAGLRLVTLEVRVGNQAARSFYRRLGFRQNGIRPGYYQDTGEDALIMTRGLGPDGDQPS